jgi:hypothetical protein
MREALAALGQAVEECRSAPVWALPAEELTGCLDEWSRLRSQLDAIGLALVREADARAVAAGQGAASTAVWLRDGQRVSVHAAVRLVKLAAAVDADLPVTGAALGDGAVNLEQVGVIARAVADLPAEHRAKGERFLLEQAAVFGPKELEVLGRRLFEVIDPEQAAEREADQLARAEQRAHEKRDFRLTDIGAGQIRLSGLLGSTDAAVVRSALDPLCAPHPDDPRSPGQRRVDALVDVCRIAMSCGQLPDNGGEPPQVVITMDLDTMRDGVGAATLDDGSPVSPTAARRMACDAGVIPVVLGGAGQVLDLGRERRLFTGPLRRAIVIRDGGCTFPGCDRPPRWCSCHHIRHWIDGGKTCLDNAVLACGYHHRIIHQGQWQVRINPTDGLPEFIPPSYVDPLRHPRRNTYHRRN